MPRADALPCLVLVLGTLALLSYAGVGGGGLGSFGGGGGGGGGGGFGPGGGHSLQQQHQQQHPPRERYGPRRALQQIARESEQVPFEFLPGTSGPAPNNWMLKDAHREIPATMGASPSLFVVVAALPKIEKNTKKETKKTRHQKNQKTFRLTLSLDLPSIHPL
jgi:hypothetical protein